MPDDPRPENEYYRSRYGLWGWPLAGAGGPRPCGITVTVTRVVPLSGVLVHDVDDQLGRFIA
jgi:hypothetical protein